MKRFALTLAAGLLASLPILAADTVVVAGGTGGTGQETVKALLASGYEVRAGTTNIERAQERFPDWDVEWVRLDVRKIDEVRAALDGADYVISAVGGDCRDAGGPNSPRYVDYEGVINMAGVARTLGLKQMVVVSAANAGVADQPLNQFCDNVQMWKWLSEDYIRDSSLPYTIVRPGGLTNEAGGQQGIDMRMPVVGSRGGQIPRADVALVLVDALGNPDAMGKTLEIYGDADGNPDSWKDDFAELPADPKQLPPLPRE